MVVVLGNTQPVEAVAVRPRVGQPRSGGRYSQVVTVGLRFVVVEKDETWDHVALTGLLPVSTPGFTQFNSRTGSEQCWNQLDAWFNYRLIEDLDELKTTLLAGLAEIDEPNLFNYLLPEDDRDECI